MIVAVIVSDRGDQYLPGCVASLKAHVLGDLTTITVDDHDHQLGMAGAVRHGWTQALDAGASYVLHVEEDFRFLEPVFLGDLVYVLDRDSTLAQVVLKRQAWNDLEQAAGGIVEADPSAYEERAAMGRNLRWTAHRKIFSLNPCLIPRHVLELGWPDGNEAEFTQRCLDAGFQFAFYGGKFDPPRVEHVGFHRSAGWRL